MFLSELVKEIDVCRQLNAPGSRLRNKQRSHK